jgi:hypothetical protein
MPLLHTSAAGSTISFLAAPKSVIRLAIAIMLAGVISYFFHHHVLWSALIVGVGYVFLVIGIIGYSVEASGDVSFS